MMTPFQICKLSMPNTARTKKYGTKIRRKKAEKRRNHSRRSMLFELHLKIFELLRAWSVFLSNDALASFGFVLISLRIHARRVLKLNEVDESARPRAERLTNLVGLLWSPLVSDHFVRGLMLVVLDSYEPNTIAFVLLRDLPACAWETAFGGHVQTSVAVQVLGEHVDVA